MALIVHSQIRKIQMNFKPGIGYDQALDCLQSFGLPVKDAMAPTLPPSIQPHSSQAAYPFLAQSSSLRNGSNSQATNNNRSFSPSQSSQVVYPSFPQQTLQRVVDMDRGPHNWVPSSAQPPSAVFQPSLQIDRIGQFDAFKPIAPRPHSGLSREPVQDHSVSIGRSWGPPAPDSVRSSQNNQTDFIYHTDNQLQASAENLLHTITSSSQQWRPASAPETQNNRDGCDSYSLSQMLPPQRKLPFPERKEEAANQESDVQVPASQDSTGKSTRPKKARTQRKVVCTVRSQSVQPVGSARKRPSTLSSATKITSPVVKKPKSREHKQGKLHSCTLCAREFSRLDHLRRHMATHNMQNTPVTKPTPAMQEIVKEPLQSKECAPSLSAPAPIAPTETPNSHSPFSTELRALRPSPPAPSDLTPTAKAVAEISTPGLRESSGNRCKSIAPAILSCSHHAMKHLAPIQPEEFMASLDTWIRKHHNLPAPPVPPRTAPEHLANYAVQSDAERSQMIDNMICECLQDENFSKLAEDVECSWKRIGLGF